ncbi:hypothetical protein MMC07_004846 [Pseudocyphellaria aurata]|nr:hypothetical protein [Pseudocyphellaria aurata]
MSTCGGDCGLLISSGYHDPAALLQRTALHVVDEQWTLNKRPRMLMNRLRLWSVVGGHGGKMARWPSSLAVKVKFQRVSGVAGGDGDGDGVMRTEQQTGGWKMVDEEEAEDDWFRDVPVPAA